VCVVVFLFGSAFPGRDALGARRSNGNASGYVLVYNGPAVCDGCAASIGEVAAAADVPVRYVARPGKVAGLLAGARAFVVPGTDDNIETMRRSFNRSVRPALRAYLRGGGRYWGLCGGAFLAGQHYWATETQYVTALGIIPANTETYSDDADPHLEKVRWYGQLRWMYYEGGPYFMPTNRHGTNVLATYSDGSIAALSYRYGEGKVIVTGVHPEATRDWLIEDGIDSAGWKPTFPLAVAMLRNLLS
jgi:glutamine amidotransferase-like uncharacterized protein